MGCEHTYVHIGESLPRHHEKTFAILLLLLTLKSASKSEQWRDAEERPPSVGQEGGYRFFFFPRFFYCLVSATLGDSSDITVLPSTADALHLCHPLPAEKPWIFHDINFIPYNRSSPRPSSQQNFCRNLPSLSGKPLKTPCRFTVLNVLQPNNNLRFKGGPSPRRIEWYKNQQHYFRVRGRCFGKGSFLHGLQTIPPGCCMLYPRPQGAVWTQPCKHPHFSLLQPIHPAHCTEATVPKESCFLDVLWVARLPLVWWTPAGIPAPQGITLLSSSQHLQFPTSWSCLASTREIVSSFSLHLRTTKSAFPGLVGLLTCSVSMETQP